MLTRARNICFVLGLFLAVFGFATSQTPTLAEIQPDELHHAVWQEEAENDYFVTSPICGECHSGIVDETGTDLSFDVAWRSSVMANAANDPYWLASVRKETLANPAELTPLIQDVCANCHMPMARFTANTQGNPQLILDEGGYADPANDLHVFAAEGVSCTICHQIQPDNFGEHESFDGNYLIDATTPIDAREIFGSREVARGSRRMQRGSGFIPVQSDHISAAEMCATCHNLTTPFLDENDEIAGMMHEQSPYSEWLNSDYATSQTCIDCHMLRAEGDAMMVDQGGAVHSGLVRHYTLEAITSY